MRSRSDSTSWPRPRPAGAADARAAVADAPRPPPARPAPRRPSWFWRHPVRDDERQRTALSEEALAQALAWMREQDTFPLDPDDESSWTNDIEEMPSLSVRDRDLVLDLLRRAVATVAQAVDLLGGPDAESDALARSRRDRARRRREQIQARG